jgi:hypothetical protein
MSVTIDLDEATAEKLASLLLGSVQLMLDPDMEGLMYDLEAFGVVPTYDLIDGTLVRRF